MSILTRVESVVKKAINERGDAAVDKAFDHILAKAPNFFVKMIVEEIREETKAEVKAFALTLADKIDGVEGN